MLFGQSLNSRVTCCITSQHDRGVGERRLSTSLLAHLRKTNSQSMNGAEENNIVSFFFGGGGVIDLQHILAFAAYKSI